MPIILLNGRFVKRILYQCDKLHISTKSASHDFWAESLTNFQVRHFIFGLIVQFTLIDETKALKLRAWGFKEIKGQPISKFLDSHIQIALHRVNKLAFDNYLRDGSIPILDKLLKPIVCLEKSIVRNCGNILLDRMESEVIKTVLKYYPISDNVEALRKKFLWNEEKKWGWLLDEAEKDQLNQSQRKAVMLDNHYNLVNAAAGTGKSSVMVAKAIYLVESGRAKPENILILAFAADAAEELRDRLSKRVTALKDLGSQLKRLNDLRRIKIKTFHALGREILVAHNHPVGLAPWVKDEASAHIAQEESLQTFVLKRYGEFVSSLSSKDQDVIESALYGDESNYQLSGAEEYERFLNSNRYYSLRRSIVKAHLAEEGDTDKPGVFVTEFVRMNYWLNNEDTKNLKFEVLRSFQEMKIANWLFIHGIEYRYEKPFKEIVDGFNAKYNPDFYLPEYDIILEHYGQDRNKQTRPGIDALKYEKQRIWKRQIMRDYGYFGDKYLETFSYHFSEDTITDFLETELVAKIKKIKPGFNLTPLPQKTLEIYFEEHARRTKKAKVLLDAIAAIRISNLSKEKVLNRLSATKVKSPMVITELFSKLASDYAQHLSTLNKIDFDDMILISEKYVSDSGNDRFRFDYILVDEFQDISQARMDLVKALIFKNNECSFTGVGDDWQSIFRFAGGQVNLITHLDHQVGNYSHTTLDETYRYKQQIADVAGAFVMENMHQLKKTITCKAKFTHEAAFHIDYSWECVDRMYTHSPNIQLFHEWLYNRVPSLPDYQETDSIAILFRYKGPKNDLEKTIDPNDKYRFLTMHASKGSEADHILILDLFTDQYLNFPSTIENHVIIEPLLPIMDKFKDAEERRLFYVALTRAKKTVVLVTSSTHQSPFVKRLVEQGLEHSSYGVINDTDADPWKCPECTTGYLKPWKNNSSNFSCENYFCDGFSFICNACNENPYRFTDGMYRCVSENCKGIRSVHQIPGVNHRKCPDCGGDTVLRYVKKDDRLKLGCMNHGRHKGRNHRMLELSGSELNAISNYYGSGSHK